MSAQPPADAALAAAVRGARAATQALSQPFGAVGFTLAAAEALPSVLEPALDALAPSPFAALFGAADPASHARGGGGGAAAARRSPPRAAPAAGVQAPAAGAKPAAGGKSSAGRGVPAPIAALAGSPLGELAQTVFSAAREAAEAAASPVVPVRAPHASAAAAASSKDPLAAMVAAMNEVVRNMKTSGSRQSSADFNAIVDTTLAAGIQALGIAADATSVVAPPAGEAIRGVQSAASAVAMQRTIGELEAALAGLSPPATAGRAPTAKGADGSAAGAAAPGAPSAVAAAGTAPGSSAPSADELRRVLLSPTVPARTPVGAAPGASESAAAAEPEELAWLVNEALVEQARRHGVDLS